MSRPSLTRAHRALLGVVAAGATLISGIGFAGSYNSVRALALQKGFGAFSYAFPIGVDAGIVVLLSLDLVLTWLRIPFPLLRQTAWLLTGATIAFNAAASWGDPLGMAMHAVIPVLFVVVVEASRHAVGRIAAITADRHMESVRLMRWVLSPVPTFRLWRRMKLWELRSYDETVRLEQNRLVYRAQLRFRYGRGWRRAAPFQALLPLKLAKYGVPLDPTILDRIDGPLEVMPAAGAAVAPGAPSISGAASSPAAAPHAAVAPAATVAPGAPVSAAVAVPTLAKLAAVRLRDAQEPGQGDDSVSPVSEPELNVWTERAVRTHVQQTDGAITARVPGQMSPWFKPPRVLRPTETGAPAPTPAGPRPVRLEQLASESAPVRRAPVRGPRPEMRSADAEIEDRFHVEAPSAGESGESGEPVEAPMTDRRLVAEALDPDVCFEALISYIDIYGHHPDRPRLAEYLTTEYGITGSRPDGSVSPGELDKIWATLQDRYVTSGRD